MVNNNQALGLISLRWRGKNYDIQKEVEFKLADVKNDDVEGGNITLYTQTHDKGTCTVTLLVRQNFNVKDFSPSLGEGELQLKAKDGKSWVMPAAWIKELPKIGAGKGTAPVTFSWNEDKEI